MGIPSEWVQDNHSRSAPEIVRGMHLQLGAGVAKLVRCGRGAIYDAVVDLRKGSPTYGQAEGFELTEDNMRVLYCPVGFGHGFCTLSEVANTIYKQSVYYGTGARQSSATRTRRSASSGRSRSRSCRRPRRTRRRPP